jgi:hypothetical protein
MLGAEKATERLAACGPRADQQASLMDCWHLHEITGFAGG